MKTGVQYKLNTKTLENNLSYHVGTMNLYKWVTNDSHKPEDGYTHQWFLDISVILYYKGTKTTNYFEWLRKYFH